MSQPSEICLFLVCGIPGSGKSSLCQSFLSRAAATATTIEPVIDVWYLSFDAAETSLKTTATATATTNTTTTTSAPTSFDPSLWKNARTIIEEFVDSFLSCPDSPPAFDPKYMQRCTIPIPTLSFPEIHKNKIKTMLILDDNFYYKSMRRVFQRMSRRYQSCYGELVVTVPLEVALRRNSQRKGTNRVPNEILERMASRFEAMSVADISTVTVVNDADIFKNEQKQHNSSSSSSSSSSTTKIPSLDVTPIWKLMVEASKSPLKSLSVPIDEVTQKIDKEATSNNVLHQLDIAMREVVGQEIKIRSAFKNGIMKEGLGKH
jgi:tRNA uridine 5-carbamoylmethylation protein Kti12